MNFITKGLLGDFIHQVYAVKNLCEKHGEKARIYITGNFAFGLERAYNDLLKLVICQDYVDAFMILDHPPHNAIDLDDRWRGYAYAHCPAGKYTYCWSEIMSKEFDFKIPENNKWINATGENKEVKNKILINYGGSNPEFNKKLDKLIVENPEDVLFITCNPLEYECSTYKDKIGVQFFRTISDMADALASCKYYIGYQSAPFALACALDIPRLVVLRDETHAGFYTGETKYSKNISYFLTNKKSFNTGFIG